MHNSHASAHLQAASVGMGPTSSRTPSPHQKNTRLPKSRPLDAITTKCPFAHQCASFRVTALPTPAPIPTGSTHVVAATVNLAGITAAQFDATAKSAFKEVVATYLSICGTVGATQCTAADVTIVSAARRDVSVKFNVKTIDATKAGAGATTLTTAITTNAATFKAQLVAKGGALASVSGTGTVAAAASAVTAAAGVTATPSMLVVSVLAMLGMIKSM